MAFDPAAYLQKRKQPDSSAGEGFDPAAYLKKKTTPSPAQVVGAPYPGLSEEEPLALFGGVIPTNAAEAKRRLKWGAEAPFALPELGLTLATGLGGGITGGLFQTTASLYEGLHGAGNTPSDTPGAHPEGPSGFGREVAESMTYSPRTEGGKKLVELASYLGVPLQKAAEFLREHEKSATGGTYGSDIGLGLLSAAAPRMPELAGRGAKVVAPVVRGRAESLVQSALKPSLKDIKSGDAAIAIDTMLEEGIPLNKAGVTRLKNRIDVLNDQIKAAIEASPEKIPLATVYAPVQQALNKVKMQVNPGASTGAIEKSWNEFKAHPLLKGADEIPVQLAQELKTGTYRELGDRAYGVTSAAEQDAQKAQKAIARGLKEGVAQQVPAVAAWNAEESRLLNTLKVAEKRILMDANKNPMGLSLLAHNPVTWVAFMADKSAAFKVMTARILNASQKQLSSVSRAGTAGVLPFAGTPGQDVEPRAEGGPVVAGRPYLVGERGPELIVPKLDGRVVPSDRASAAQENSRKHLARKILFDAKETGKVLPEEMLRVISMPDSTEKVAKIMRTVTPENRTAIRRAHFEAMIAAASDEEAGKINGARLIQHMREMGATFQALYGRDAQSIRALAGKLAELGGIFELPARGMSGPVPAMKHAIEARADGGPIVAGRPYLVGERGPEVIIPQANGQVIPNEDDEDSEDAPAVGQKPRSPRDMKEYVAMQRAAALQAQQYDRTQLPSMGMGDARINPQRADMPAPFDLSPMAINYNYAADTPYFGSPTAPDAAGPGGAEGLNFPVGQRGQLTVNADPRYASADYLHQLWRNKQWQLYGQAGYGQTLGASGEDGPPPPDLSAGLFLNRSF